MKIMNAGKYELVTAYRKLKNERDEMIYRDYTQLLSIAGAQRMVILERLREKYNVSIGTLYSAIRNGEKLLNG